MKKKNDLSTQTGSKEELIKEVKELEIKLAKFMVNRYTKPSKNTRESRTMRHRLSQIKTFIRQKELNNG